MNTKWNLIIGNHKIDITKIMNDAISNEKEIEDIVYYSGIDYVDFENKKGFYIPLFKARISSNLIINDELKLNKMKEYL